MRLPRVHGTIKRRLLINYRVDPSVMSRQLPLPFRPKLHENSAIAGICLICLEDIRPRRFPLALGLSSENAAHRIAVVWEDQAGSHEGVYQVTEDDQSIALHMRSADGQIELDVVGRTAAQLPASSHFATVSGASSFFESGGVGYSVTSSGNRLDGVVLKTDSWQVEPLAVERAYSSYFDDRERFPTGSICFDCGLVMRNIPHEWETAEDMYVTGR